MKEKIRFENHVQRSTFHNPLLGNRLDTQQMEIRRDPLTGRQSVLNPSLQDKGPLFYGTSDHALLERLARESEPKCFLCGDRWKEMTPRYPEDLVPGGRIQVGESVLFPNLFPVSQVHAVLRVGSSHYVPLQKFSAPLIHEAFMASSRFVTLLSHARDPVRFLTINGNYLGPAGASILHPHFQVLGSDIPYTHTEELLALGSAYHGQHGSCYWADLAERERELGARFIARTGGVSWVAAFSPQGTNEVVGVLTEKRDFLEMEDRDWAALAEGFSAVLQGYGSMGISTFNFALYSGPLGARDDTFRCFLRVISRQNVYENYRTDDYFLQKLLRNELILNPPEKLASILRGFFTDRRREN